MRALKAKDIAPFSKVIAKMELKEAIRNMFAQAKDESKDKKPDQNDNGKLV